MSIDINAILKVGSSLLGATSKSDSTATADPAAIGKLLNGSSKKGAKVLDAAGGAIKGASLGTKIGTIIPGIGNIVGGVVGGLVGLFGKLKGKKNA